MSEKKFDKVKYDNDFIRKNYDRLTLTIPKGYKNPFKAYCKRQGISINRFVYESILTALLKDCERMKDKGAEFSDFDEYLDKFDETP